MNYNVSVMPLRVNFIFNTGGVVLESEAIVLPKVVPKTKRMFKTDKNVNLC